MRIEKEGPCSVDERVCSFCGAETASVFWNGPKVVLVCQACCLDALPALIADGCSVAGTAAASRVAGKMQERFWQALALRLLREANAVDCQRSDDLAAVNAFLAAFPEGVVAWEEGGRVMCRRADAGRSRSKSGLGL